MTNATLGQIIATACSMFRVTTSQLLSGYRGVETVKARKWLCDGFVSAGYSLHDVKDYVGYLSHSTVINACKRQKEKHADHKKLAREINEALQSALKGIDNASNLKTSQPKSRDI